MRKNTKTIYIGTDRLAIGGDSPITVQSMTTTDTRDAESTANQINALAEAGCDIARVAVPNMQAAETISAIKQQISIPLVADIHFDYRLALTCMRGGVDKVRINPGNIGDMSRVRAVADAAKERGIPIRIGVNGGSLEKDILEKHGRATPEALVESALNHAKMLEDCDFGDTILSLKASSVPDMIAAYRLASEKTDYPLHLGVTEAGTYQSGVIKSAIGIGSLLADGIGDTIRVSLTDNPIREVEAGIMILKSLNLRRQGVEIVSCPTCGRCKIALIDIANTVTELTQNMDKDIKIAVMGCAVNGPGEAKDADIGIAGGDSKGLIFKKGEIFKQVAEHEIVSALMYEIENM